jgi:hypothetical protein
MNKKLSAVSIGCNVALVVGLLWMRSAHVQEVHRIADAAMSEALQAILEAGDMNIAARERAGFGH